MKLEIVSHCYCPPGVTAYAQMLHWQWQSLLNSPCGAFDKITLIVSYTSTDRPTCDLINRMLREETDSVKLNPWCLEPAKLFRRSVGRNIIARTTGADIVWFADVDYFVTPEFLQSIADAVDPSAEALYYPSHIRVSNSHKTGDLMLKEYTPGKIDEYLFYEAKIRKAIGGVQIVPGGVARKYGYNDGTKWTRPVKPDSGFRQCRGDVAYRRRLSKELGSSQRFPASGLYRIRHAKDGRDYNLEGQKGEGKSFW